MCPIPIMTEKVYGSASEAEQKEFMRAFIERIELFPEAQKDGNWIRNIVFNFPVPVNGGEVKELPLEYESTVETIAVLSRKTQRESEKNLSVDSRVGNINSKCTRFKVHPLQCRDCFLTALNSL